MASKRIAQSAVNWNAIADRVPMNQKASYLAFKSRSDGYLRRVQSNPECPPKIDWGLYKSKVRVAGMVDTFQKSYESLTIPFPPDNVSKLVDEQEKQVKAEIADFKKQSDARINTYKSQLAHLSGLLPYDQMTMEDFKDSYPDLALDSIKKPTFWPHDAEEQVDYRDKGHPLYGTDPHH